MSKLWSRMYEYSSSARTSISTRTGMSTSVRTSTRITDVRHRDDEALFGISTSTHTHISIRFSVTDVRLRDNEALWYKYKNRYEYKYDV